MLMTCIKKEILSNILSLRYTVVFFLFVTVIVSATVVRTHIYRKQVTDYHLALSERKKSMTMARRFWQSRGLGITVEKAPNPLSIFAFGLENEMVRSFSLSDWFPPTVGERKLSNPVFRYFLNLDIVLVVNIICSLLALLLVYDSICGEREQGTLKIMLSGPLPRDVIIISKMAAGLITLFVPFLVSIIISLLYVFMFAKVPFTPPQMRHIAMIVALSLIYLGFFFALGTAVSCLVNRSATSLVVSLFVWVIIVLGIPNLVPMIMKHVRPIPPQSKIIKEKQAIRDYVGKVLEPKWAEELRKQEGILDYGLMGSRLRVKRDEEIGRREAKINKFYNNRIEGQARLSQAVSRVSPSAGYLFAATEMAGTGVNNFMGLLSNVDAFQREFLKVQNEQEQKRIEAEEARRKAGLPPPKEEDRRDAYDPELWPTFETRELSFARAFNVAAVDIVLLVSYSVVFFLVGFIGFMRYDPR